MNLADHYRPKCCDQVIGQKQVVDTLKTLKSKGHLAGRAYWISGKSGTGKTTIARIIARPLSDKWHTSEIDAGQLTTKGVAQMREDQYYKPMTCDGRVYIVNEAHGLRKDVVRAFLVFLEELAEFTTVIFTTTIAGQMEFEDTKLDAGPLLSRCLPMELDGEGLELAYAKHVKGIAVAEGLDGAPIARYLKLAEDTDCNMRAMLQAVEAGLMCH